VAAYSLRYITFIALKPDSILFFQFASLIVAAYSLRYITFIALKPDWFI
jgi:hypothetical protein